MRPPASVRRPPVAPQGHCRRSQGTAGRYGLHTLRLREQVPRVRRSRGLEFGTRWRRFGRAPSPAETHDIPTARGWTRPARHSRAAARVGALVCVEAERRRWRAGWRLAPRAPRARAERDSHEIAWAGARFGQGHETRRRCPAAARVNAELPRRARRVATRERTGIGEPGLRICRRLRECASTAPSASSPIAVPSAMASEPESSPLDPLASTLPPAEPLDPHAATIVHTSTRAKPRPINSAALSRVCPCASVAIRARSVP
jgi:hypothetical protein